MSANPSTAVPAVVSEPAPASASSPAKITQEQLEQHVTQKDFWILISGKGASRAAGEGSGEDSRQRN